MTRLSEQEGHRSGALLLPMAHKPLKSKKGSKEDQAKEGQGRHQGKKEPEKPRQAGRPERRQGTGAPEGIRLCNWVLVRSLRLELGLRYPDRATTGSPLPGGVAIERSSCATYATSSLVL